MKRNLRGFTLIELLIVIAVLGILAAGILATIDPFEQFKKARDSNARNTVVELYNGFVRYNANHGNWPWNAGGGCNTPVGVSIGSAGSCINHLIDDGELKAGFSSSLSGASAITTARIHYISGPSENVAICFQPESKSLKKDTATQYNSTGGVGTSCNSASSTCYWCAK